MVFHLPNEASLRTSHSYSDMFLLTLVWNIGLLGIVVSVLFLLFYILKKYQLKMAQNGMMKDSMLTTHEQGSAQRVIAEREEMYHPEEERLLLTSNPQTLCFKISNLFTSIFFYLFWMVVGLIYLALYMFGTFGRGVHIDILSVLAMTCAVVLPTLIWKYYTKVNNIQRLKTEICITIGLLVLWLGVCIFAVIVSKGACLCYFTQDYGFKVEKDLSLSTQFTRLSSLHQVCANLEICHLYATLPEDGSTAVFFNIHSGTNLDNLTLVLQFNNSIEDQKISQNPYKMENVDWIGQRCVHSVLFQNLKQDTLYTLSIYNSDQTLLKQINYRTLPGPDASNLRIAAGGDLGMNDQGRLMTSYLTAFDPHVIIIGGDTVYDNGLRTCFYNWDIFYAMFEPVYTKLNRLIPLVMSIGNHDVGFDALDNVTLSSQQNYFPLFFVYNPQHLSENKTVPSILDRKSSHFHLIGPIIHFNMDSGYIQNFSSQVAPIISTINNYPHLYRFGNYHNPLFPACTDSTNGSNDRLVIAEGKKEWLPLFDNYSFTTVLEHHTHYRKMSHILYNETISEEGTRYIGDGSWGVPQDPCHENRHPPHLQLLDDYEWIEPNHFWEITLIKNQNASSPYSINYTAIGVGNVPVKQKIDVLPNIKVMTPMKE